MAAVKENVKTEMVSVDGPSPGSSHRWFSEDEKVVRVLVHDPVTVTKFAEEVVDAYAVGRFGVAFRGQRRFEDGKDRKPDLFGTILHP